MLLLTRTNQKGEHIDAKSKLEYVMKSVLKQISIFVDALITFYSLDDQVRNERDLKRELFVNLITNMVLEGELYFLVHNLTSIAEETKL
jgi:hypothetical protein